MNQRRIVQFISIILLVILGIALVPAQPAQAWNWSNCTSIQNGSWDDYSTWSCSSSSGTNVPSDHTNVTIHHIVTIGSTHAGQGSFASAGSIYNDGKLIMNGSVLVWGPSTDRPWVSIDNYLGGIYEGYGEISFLQGSGYNASSRNIVTGGWGEYYAPRIGCGDQYWYDWGPLTCNISGNFQAISNTQPEGYGDRVGNVVASGNVTIYETWYQYSGTITFNAGSTLTLDGHFGAGAWTYWNTSNQVEIPNVVVNATNGWNVPPSVKRINNYKNYSNGITKFNWGNKWNDLTIGTFNNYAGVFDFSGLSSASLTIGDLDNAGNTNAYIYSNTSSSSPLYLSGQINNTNANNSYINRKIVLTGGTDQTMGFGGWSAIHGLEVNKSGGRAILNNNLYVQGNVDVTSGTLDLGPYTLSASNTALTVQNNAGYYVSGASGLQYAGFNSVNFNYGCALGFTGSAARDLSTSMTGTSCTSLYLSGGAKTISSNLSLPGWLYINGATLNLGSKNLYVGGNLNLAGAGALNSSTGVVTVGGDFSQNASNAFNPGTGTLVLTGASRSMNSGGAPFNFNNLTIQSGASYTPTSGAVLNVVGDWINNGSFIPNGSTVNLTGTNQIISGANTFYNLTKNSGAAAVLSFPAGKKQTITNALNLSGGSSASRLALRSSTAGTPWQIDAQNTLSLFNLDVRDSNNVNASAMAAPTTNGNLDNGNNTNWNFVPTTVTSLTAPAAKTYKIDDTLDFTVNFTNIVTVAGATKPRLELTLGSSTLYANYFSGSGSKNIVFRYTVQSGDLDSDGIVLGTLGLNGGTMIDNASAPADLALNNVASTALVKLDGVAPAVSSVTLPADKTYGLGDVLEFSVTFSEPVTVSGAPKLPLTVGAASKTASYLSGSGTSTLNFRYIVGATDVDADGIVLSALSLNSGTILDAAGNPSALTLNGLPSAAGVQVDGTGPVTSSVAVPTNGTYKIGDTLDFTVNWNKNVTVAGLPRLALTVGSATRYASYVSGSGSSALVFRYTVGESDLDSDGIAVSALVLNNGTLQDAALGNAANLGLNAIASTANVKVDGVRAVVTSVAGPNAGTYAGAEDLTFTVNWSKIVIVSGSPRLEINFAFTDTLANPIPTRYADYVSGSGSTALTFKYTTAAGEDGTLAGINNQIDLNSGSIQDAVNNAANLAFSLYTGDGILVDTTPPAISSVTLPDPGSYRAVQNLSFKIFWNEPIYVTSVPQLTLTIGSQTVQAVYQSFNSSTSMSFFTYTIVAPNTDPDGISVDSLDLNGGSIADGADNGAALTLPALDASKILVDTSEPTVSAITRISSSPTLASSVQFQVKFSEPVSGLSASNLGFATSGIGGTPVIDSITGSGDTYTVDVSGYTGSGTLGLNKSVNTGVKDLAGNTLTNSANDTGAIFDIDNQSPSVSSIDLPAAKTYTTKTGNDTLSFTLNWIETVHVNVTSGTPRLALSVGAATRYATYQSGSDSSALIFSYTVSAADQAASGISIAELQLNGGSITDVAGNPAFLNLPAADASGVKVQGTFALTLLTGGGGMGDVTVIPNQTSFNDGDIVSLTATPLSNSLYVGASRLTWTPDNVSTPSNYTASLTMTADSSITVYFEIKGAAYVDPTYDASTPGWGITRFASIQTAINTVAAGTLLNVSGTYTESVTLNKNINLVLLNNTVINGSITQSDGTLDMPGGTLTLNGSLTNTAGTFNANGGMLKLTGASPSLSAGLTLANVEMAGSGTLTSGAVTLSGNLTLTSGAFSPASNTVLKSVSIASGSILNAPAGTLSVGGNWNNNGTFNGNGGTLIFNGSGDQSLGGSSALSFSALQIASGGKVSTSKALTVSGQLAVNSGAIDPFNGSSFGSLTIGQAGEFNLSSGATVSVTGAVNNAGAFAPAGGTFNVGGLFTNSGSYAQTGGTVNANSGFSNSGTFAQDGGSLAVTGAFDNTGSFAQKSGSLTISGAFSNEASASYLQTGGTTTAASLANAGSFAQSGGTLDLSGAFDNTGTYAQSGTGAVTVGGNFTDSGTASFSATGGTLNLKGDLTHSGTGTFNASGGTVDFNGTIGQTMSGPLTFANLTMNNAAGVSMPSGTLSVAQDFNLSQGSFDAPTGADFNNLILATGTTFKAPAGSMSVSGNLTRSGTAAFNANGGAVVFDGSGTQTVNGAVGFYNLSVNQSAGSLLTSDAALTVANTTTITSGTFAPAALSDFNNVVIASGATFSAPAGNISVAGDWTNNGAFNANGGTVTFDGSAAQLIGGSTQPSFYDLIIANTSASAAVSFDALTPAVQVSHTLTVADGIFQPSSGADFNKVVIASGATLSAPAGNITVAGDWTNDGSFTPNGGTVTFDGSTSQTIAGGVKSSFNNLSIANSATSPAAVKFGLSTPAPAVSGLLAIQDGIFQPPSASDFNTVTIASGATLSAPAGNITVAGDWTNNGAFTPNGGTVTFDGSGAQTIDGSTTTAFYDLTVNKSAGTLSGTTPVAVANALNLLSGSFAPAALSDFNTVTIASGATLSAPAGNITVAGDWTNDGAFTPNGGTVTFDGSTSQTIAGGVKSSFNNLSIANSAASPAAVKFGLTTPAPAVSGLLAIQDGIFQPPSASDFNTVTIASGATLTAPAGNLNVSGDWTNLGSFVPGTSGTVTFNGVGAQALSGDTSFNNLALGASAILQPAKNVNISLGGDLNVAAGGQFDSGAHLPNTLTVTGSNTHITSGSTLANLVIASGAKLTSPAQLNLLGNWTNQGTFDANGGTASFVGSGVQTLSGDTSFNNLAVGASAILQPAKDINIHLAGDLSVAAGGQFDTASHLPNTLTVTGSDSHITSGTTLSNLVIGPSAKLTGPAALSLLGNWTNNGTFAANGGKVTFDGAGAQQIDGASTTTFQDLTINKASGTLSSLTKLNVLGLADVQKGGFSPASGSTLTNLLIESLGTLSAPTGDLAVGGNWTNNGSFIPGSSGSVTFNGTGAQSISGSTTSAFHDLTVNKPSGSLAASTPISVSNLLDVKSGSFAPASASDFNNVVVESGAVLSAPSGEMTVSGNWANQGTFNPGSGTVTFDGTSAQAITGTANFNSLALNNPVSVSSVQPLSVLSTLSLLQGSFNPPSNSQLHNLSVSSGTTFTLDSSDVLDISGNFSNAGTFSPTAGSKVVFNGSADQQITNTPTSTPLDFSLLEIKNSGGKVSSTSPLHAGATTVTQGTFIPGDLSVFNSLSIGALGAFSSPTGGAVAVTYDLVNNGDFTSSGGSLNVGGSFYNQGSYSASGGTTRIAGNLTNSGSYAASGGDLFLGGNLSNTATFNPGSGTVTFDGSTPQTITGTGISFANLVLSNATGVSASQPLSVKDTLTLAKGIFNPPSGSQFHNLAIQSGSSLILDTTDTISISGDLTNSGTFTPKGSTVILNGDSAQTIGGSLSSPVNFKNLIINNTALPPAAITTTSPVTVSGTTTINDGILIPDNNSYFSDILIQPNGAFEVADPDTITVTGSLTNNGTFSPTGGYIDLWNSFVNNGTFSPTGGEMTVGQSFTNSATGTYAPLAGIVNVVLGDFTNAGTFAALGGDLNLSHNLVNNGSFDAIGGTVSMIGTSPQQISGSSPATFASLILDNTFGVSASNPLTVLNDLHLNSASFNPPSGSQLGNLFVEPGATFALDPSDTLSVSGSIFNNGTLTPNGARMILNGSTPQAISGTPFDFGDLTIQNASSSPVTASFPLVVAGLLNITDGTLNLPAGSDLNDLSIASGASLNGSAGDFTVSGDWSNLGSFVPGSNTVTFDGSGTQLLSGATTFNTVNIGALSTLLLDTNANLNLAGSLTGPGALDATTNEPTTLTLTGPATHNLPAALALDNLVIASGATLVAPPTLSLAGDFTNNGSFNPNGGSLTLDGSTPQILGGSGPLNFNDLIINNTSPSGAVSSSTPLTVAGLLTVNDGIFQPAPASSFNDLSIGPNGTLDSPAGTLLIGGDFTNNGSFVPNPDPASSVTFNGSGPQLIGGSEPVTFTNLIIANTSASDPVTATNPITVLGSLDIANGSFAPADGSVFSDITIDPGSILIIPTGGGITIGGTLENNGPAQLRTLSLATTGEGSGSFNTLPVGNTFNDGQVVSVTAVPAKGSHFNAWGGAMSGSASTQSITMSANRSASAEFLLNTYQLTIQTSGTGSGSVELNKSGPTFKFGTLVTLTPKNGTRSAFVAWGGAASGSTTPLQITIDADKTINAVFNLTSVIVSGNAGAPDTLLSYTDGTQKSVLTALDGSYSFEVPANWSGRVTPSRFQWRFQPAYRSIPALTSDLPNQNFTANQIYYTYLPSLLRLNPEKVVYTQDFSNYNGREWSSGSWTVAPYGEKFLGEFGSEYVTLDLADLPNHNAITVSFDLYLLRTWDGNAFVNGPGPDLWQLKADNTLLLNTTFSNYVYNQSYPDTYPSGDYPLRTNATAVNSLGYNWLGIPMDSTYHLTFTFNHLSPSLRLRFEALGLQRMSDESWGIDNVRVATTYR